MKPSNQFCFYYPYFIYQIIFILRIRLYHNIFLIWAYRYFLELFLNQIYNKFYFIYYINEDYKYIIKFAEEIGFSNKIKIYFKANIVCIPLFLPLYIYNMLLYKVRPIRNFLKLTRYNFNASPFNANKDYYKTLGLEKTATDA